MVDVELNTLVSRKSLSTVPKGYRPASEVSPEKEGGEGEKKKKEE